MAKITADGYAGYKVQVTTSKDETVQLLKSIAKNRTDGERAYTIAWGAPTPAKNIEDPFDDLPKEKQKTDSQEYFKVDGQTMIANLENKPEIVRDILKKMEEIVVNNNIYSNMEVMKAFNEMYIAIETITKTSSKNVDRNVMNKLVNAKALADRILY